MHAPPCVVLPGLVVLMHVKCETRGGASHNVNKNIKHQHSNLAWFHLVPYNARSPQP